MLYSEFLKTLTGCPFCEGKHQRIIKKDDHAFLTYALAPYHKHHLLVIPRRHTEVFCELSKEEMASIESLLNEAGKILTSLGYKDYSILLRNGDLGKSVPHLHYNIIPSALIGDLDHQGEERKVMTEEEAEQLFEELENIEQNI